MLPWHSFTGATCEILAACPMLYPFNRIRATQSNAAPPIQRCYLWIGVAIMVFTVFAATMGLGISSRPSASNGKPAASYFIYCAGITPQAIRLPALPVGSVFMSSAFSWTMIEWPMTEVAGSVPSERYFTL